MNQKTVCSNFINQNKINARFLNWAVFNKCKILPKNIAWNCLGLKFQVKFHNFFDPIINCIEWENLTWLKTNFSELKRPKILNFKSISRNFANKFQTCTLPLKFIYSEKATTFCEISTIDLSYIVPVKSMVEISQNIEAVSEHINFTIQIWIQ